MTDLHLPTTLPEAPEQPYCQPEIVPLAFLYRISRELSSGLELRTLLEHILALSMENVGATSASIIVLDAACEPLDSIIISNDMVHADTTHQLRPVFEQGLAGWVLQHRQNVLVSDTSREPRWLHRPDDNREATGAKSAVSVLITARDDPVGVMTIVHATPAFFRQDHLELIQAIADQAGVAILNARLYEQSRRQYKELQTAHQRYRELQENLTAMIYHDMRSPLANILNSLEVMRNLLGGEADATLLAVFAIAERAAGRIQRLTNSLLDINRLESGQPITQRKLVDPAEILQEAIDNIRPILMEKRQHFRTEFGEGLPQIYIERDMILRVLINLLENASKYSSAGQSVTLGAGVQEIEGAPWITIWVQDSGLGIPTEDLDFIFQKFARSGLHSSTIRGVGLGLTFCRLAVEGHGGRIWAESRVDHGSRFTFQLPVVPLD